MQTVTVAQDFHLRVLTVMAMNRDGSTAPLVIMTPHFLQLTVSSVTSIDIVGVMKIAAPFGKWGYGTRLGKGQVATRGAGMHCSCASVQRLSR